MDPKAECRSVEPQSLKVLIKGSNLTEPPTPSRYAAWPVGCGENCQCIALPPSRLPIR